MRRLFAVLLLLVCPQSFAWGVKGHQIVARFAEQELSVSTRDRVKLLLGGASLQSIANEPDAWVNARPETRPWHYVDIPTTETNYDAQRDCTEGCAMCAATECVIARITSFQAILADTTKPASERREALIFLTHFVGDLHQPLHTAAQFFSNGSDDRGGGTVKVTWFGQTFQYEDKKWSLHSVWDSGIINQTGLSVTEYVHYLAEEQVGDRSMASIATGTVEDWANEAHQIAVDSAYDIPTTRKLGSTYQRRNEPVVDEQLLRAGARLARLIEEALGDHTATTASVTAGRCTTPRPLPNRTTFTAVTGVDDGDCGDLGDATEEAKQAQNRAKNNLCATNNPIPITPVTLSALQEASATITKPPKDRSRLPGRTTTNGDEIREGTLVVMTGWVLRAKGTGAESVNCAATQTNATDIHLSIAQDPKETNECYAATVEMIPHYRPAEWRVSAFHYLAKLKPQKKNGTLEYTDYETNKRPPVRVTGQLFFDASHRVCKGGNAIGGQPARYSNWEIHPVYNFEVCTAADHNQCVVDDDTVWTSLTDWQHQ
jgi:hypothetical protein